MILLKGLISRNNQPNVFRIAIFCFELNHCLSANVFGEGMNHLQLARVLRHNISGTKKTVFTDGRFFVCAANVVCAGGCVCVRVCVCVCVCVCVF